MQIPLLPYQKRFLQSSYKYTYLKVGLGGGKTFALSMYIISRMLTNPETLGLIAANSYQQLTGSILTELFAQLDKLGITYSYNTLSKELQLHCNGAKALCVSLEKYEQLRGIEVGYLAIDELAYARHEAFLVAIGRLRCKHSHKLEGRFTSTPNSFNWMYDIFASNGYISRSETPIHHNSEYHEMISATAYDNFFLPEDYIPSLESQYSSLMLEQELNAEFVNLTAGRVYHAFDRTTQLKVSHDISPNVFTGQDYNVNPCTTILASVVGGKIHVYDEIWLENSNSFDLADELNKRAPGCVIYPDASGAARHTSASKSDHQIMRDAGFDVRTRRKNPSVKDRYNNVNRMLAAGDLTIDPKCKHLIQDLEKMTHENDDPMLSHMSDCLGYLCWGINPLKRKQLKSRVL